MIKRLVCAAAFVVSLLLPNVQAHADPVTVTTPKGYKVTKRGGCLIIPTRSGATPQQWDDSWCDRISDPHFNGVGLADLYSWTPDFLVRALDFSEQLACGSLRCATGSREVRIVLVRDGLVNAMVSDPTDTTKMFFVVTTGLIDFVENAVVSYLDEVQAQIRGEKTRRPFTDWIATVDSHAGHSCNLSSPSALRQLTANEMRDVRGAAQIFYTYVMGHELAHVRSAGGNCGTSGAADLERETACDRMSFDAMFRGKAVMPLMLFAPLVAVSHYESVYDQPLGAIAAASTGKPLRKAFQARQFEVRARAMRDQWANGCRSGAPGNLACPSGQQTQTELYQEADRIIGLHLPQACVSGAPDPAPIARAQAGGNDEEARKCIALAPSDRMPFTFDKSGGTVAVDVSYRDVCPRPIECTVTIWSGTKPRADKDDSRWAGYVSMTQKLALSPGGSGAVRGQMNWSATDERMPSMRYPEPPSENLELVRCVFTGPAQAAPASASSDFCKALSRMLDAASGGFSSIRGPDDSSLVTVPGSSSCDVYSDFVSCDMPTTTDYAAASSLGRDLTAKVAQCLPSPLWTKRTRQRDKDGDHWDYFEFSRGEGLPSAQVEVRRRSGGKKHEVSVEVHKD